MTSSKRIHQTVRPHRLSLGVLAEPPVTEVLQAGMAPLSIDQSVDLVRAMLIDSVTGLATFPVRHRMVFVPATHQAEMHVSNLVPASWQVRSLDAELSPIEQVRVALADLLATGAEAAMLVRANAPMAPLGEMFDAMLWLLSGNRLTIGSAEEDAGPYAIGASETAKALVPKMSGEPAGLAAVLPELAADAGAEVSVLEDCYLVRDETSLRRFVGDIEQAPFSPAVKHLFEREDIAQALGLAPPP